MLSERFIVSTRWTEKASPPPAASLKDVGICIQELQPTPGLRGAFKKSSTAANCLAVSASHVFAAQADKAVLHVYSREKGSQEAVVPFPERIRSIALAPAPNGDGDILVLGTEGGRLIVWETSTGRQVASTASHLQPVTSLAVDPTCNFVLSGSLDANIHVWCLVDMLSFARRDGQQAHLPLRTLSSHRGAVTGLALGHSAGRCNIAVSTAEDNTAIAWDYRTGTALRTFLLPLSASCVTLDPVDRAFYVGYGDGSIQAVDFYSPPSVQHPLHGQSSSSSSSSSPVEISSEDRWLPPSPDCGAVQAISLSYDGTTVLSGHQGGKTLSWSAGRRKYTSAVADYTYPVTNIIALQPDGLTRAPHQQACRVTHAVVKPRYESAVSAAAAEARGVVPADYSFTTQIICAGSQEENEPFVALFSRALCHATFPESMIEDGLAELAALGQRRGGGAVAQQQLGIDREEALAKDSQIETLEQELARLKTLAAVSESARQASADEVVALRGHMASLHDHVDELRRKQAQTQQAQCLRRARKEEREHRRRAAWFAAEKKGNSGDAAMAAVAAENSAQSSDTDDLTTDED